MISNLQVLRAIAAAMVVCHHIREPLAEAFPALSQIHLGAAGVDVFFVLSGVVISLAEQKRRYAPLAFLRRRILRVVPMYWLSLWLVGAALLAGLSPVGVQMVDGTLANMLKSMFFVPFERAHGATMPLLGVGWTLNYEMFFYLVFSFLIFLPAAPRALALVGVMAVLALTSTMISPQNVVLAFYLNPILLEFAVGVVLAQLWVRRDGFAPGGAIPGALLMLSGAAWFFAAAAPEDFAQLMPSRLFLFGIPAVLCVAGAMLLEHAGHAMRGRFWMLLGAASYVLYLFHAFVLQALEKAWPKLGLSLADPAQALAFALAAFVLAHLAGTAIHLWIERPVTSAMRRWLGESRPVVPQL